MSPAPRAESHIAETALYRRWWPAVVDFVARRLGNWEEAEALAQEALIRAIDAAGRETIHNFQAYVLRIAANLATDHARRKDWSARREDPDLLLSDGEPELVDLGRLRAAVDELAPELREIVELRYVDGRSFAEIADELEMSKNGVFARHSRALDVLRARFAGRRS